MTKLLRRSLVAGLGYGAATLAAPNLLAQPAAFRIRRRRDFVSFDPAFSVHEDETVTTSILAPPMRYRRRASPQQTWEVVYHLADQVSFDNQNNDIKIRLRPENWKESSQPILADDAKFTYERLLASTGPGSVSWRSVSGIRTNDDRTLTISLSKPESDFTRLVLARGAASILRRQQFPSPLGSNFALSPPDYSGSYRITELLHGNRLVLDANRDWRGERPLIQRVEFRFLPDDGVAKDMMEEGHLDALEVTLEQFSAGLSRLRRVATLLDAPTGRMAFLAPVPRSSVFWHPSARRAMQAALDRDEIVAAAFGGQFAKSARSFAPSGWSPEYTSFGRMPERDGDRARVYLRDSGSVGKDVTIGFSGDAIIASPIILRQLTSLGLRCHMVDVGPSFAPSNPNASGLDAVVSLIPVWRVGPVGFLAAILGLHPDLSGSQDQNVSNLKAALVRAEASGRTSDALAVANGIVEGAYATVLYEEQKVWAVRSGATAEFGPHGSIVNLDAWDL